MKPIKIALVLSGCGVFDGAEITEAVGLNIAASEHAIEVEFFAPNRNAPVFDHLRGEESGESRNLLTEAARIARGKISQLSDLKVENFSALVLAGGFGAVKNFTNFLEQGENATLQSDILRVFADFFAAKKPVVGVCAAPLAIALAARELNLSGVNLTLGDNCSYAGMTAAAKAWGVNPLVSAVDEAVVDRANRIITVPAYMYGDATPAQVFSAMRAAISNLKALLNEQ